jgi:surfeit locus 1 family protein
MMARYLSAIMLGVGGVAILLALGFWQLRRLDWKETVLAQIEAQMLAAPTELPASAGLDPEAARYQPVKAVGRTTGAEILVLSGNAGLGPGYEVVSGFETATGRRILLDRGFVADGARRDPRPAVALSVSGNLHWPQEADAYTPPPDIGEGIWFARDVPLMAAALGTEPLMIVVRQFEGDGQGIVPVPVDTDAIPNDHLHYAITWFSLAMVWAGMTVFLLWRIRQGTN